MIDVGVRLQLGKAASNDDALRRRVGQGSPDFSEGELFSTMSARPASDSDTFFISVNFWEPVTRNCPFPLRVASTATFRYRNNPGAYWTSSMITGAG